MEELVGCKIRGRPPPLPTKNIFLPPQATCTPSQGPADRQLQRTGVAARTGPADQSSTGRCRSSRHKALRPWWRGTTYGQRSSISGPCTKGPWIIGSTSCPPRPRPATLGYGRRAGKRERPVLPPSAHGHASRRRGLGSRTVPRRPRWPRPVRSRTRSRAPVRYGPRVLGARPRRARGVPPGTPRGRGTGSHSSSARWACGSRALAGSRCLPLLLPFIAGACCALRHHLQSGIWNPRRGRVRA